MRSVTGVTLCWSSPNLVVSSDSRVLSGWRTVRDLLKEGQGGAAVHV